MNIEPLNAHDLMRLRAAEGWLELGDCVSAKVSQGGETRTGAFRRNEDGEQGIYIQVCV
jgi:hypothetical protein